MRTIEQVWHQIRWDPRLDPARFVLGIDVHRAAPKCLRLPDFVPGGDIPWHRVLFVEIDGQRCWDRRAGLDTVDEWAASGRAAPRVLGPPLWDARVAHRWDGGDWVPAATGGGEPIERLRVLTWNVLWDRFDAEAIRSDERWPRLLDAALDTGADVIAFQEVEPAFHRRVLEHPRVRAAFWVSHPLTHPDVGWADLLLLGRVPIRDLAWRALGPHKAALAAVLDHGPVVVTTHLTSDHTRDAAARRAEELRQVRDALAGLRRPWVLLGDLNLPDEAPVEGTADAWIALRDPAPTFEPARNPLAALSSRTGQAARLDRVLLGGDVVPEHVERIGRDPVDAVVLSDHWGVLADLRLEADPARYVGASTVRSALAWLPPAEACDAVQAVRAARDPRGAARWPPHVNVLWGFVPEADLDAATPALTAAAHRAEPFATRLGRLGRFEASHHLAPDDPAPWRALHQRFRRHLPAAGADRYAPHLTVARGDDPLPPLPPVHGRVDRLAVLTRRGDAPFAVRGWVRLGEGVDWLPEPPWPPGEAADAAPVLEALGAVVPVVPVGSTALGTAIDGGDVDVLALAPAHDPEALRQRLVRALRPVSSVVLRKAGLDGIRLRLADRAVDLVLVPIGDLTVDEAVARRLELPEAAARALGAASDAAALLDRVAGREAAFRALCRWVKAFARAHALDDAALGGVEGLAWAVLAAEVAAGADPDRPGEALVPEFVARWAAWDWRCPVGGPADPALEVCVHTPSAPVRPITRRADRRRLEEALLRAWEAVERGAGAVDLLRPPAWHRSHAEAVEVRADDDRALGAARGKALHLIRALGGRVAPRRLRSGFALGLPQDADPDAVDAAVAAWAADLPGVVARRCPSEDLE